MFGWITLAACSLGPEAPEPSARTNVYPATHTASGDIEETTEPGGYSHLLVDVVARVRAPGEPAAWTAQVIVDGVPEPTPTGCEPIRPTPGGSRGPNTISIGGPIAAELAWVPETGRWTASGPGSTRDPAWSVGSVTWTDDRTHVADGAVRFGGVPDATTALREREGDVWVLWDAPTADTTDLLSVGPGGPMRCGTEEGRVRLPWWAVSAYQGEVVLRSTRTHHQLIDGVLVTTRTTIERVIPLDEPTGTTAEEKSPRFVPYTPTSTPRLTRVRRPVG